MSQFVRGQRLTAFSARRHRWISATTSFQWTSLFLLACLFVAAESDNIITISQVEVEALREFVTAINLNYNGSRLNTTNACTTELPGMVECNATGITQLNFTSRNLTGTLPANLSKLTQLRDVIVYNNRLHGTVPTEYSRWGQSIRSFSLYTNNFTGTLPSSFRNWTLVQVFDAHENQLSGTLPDEYSEWRNLTTLLLAQNRLTGTLPAKYSTWGSSIKYFEVENNNFNGSMPPDYSNFTNLTSFYVSDCGLSGTLPESYAQMTRLESLRCSSNQLTGTLPHSYGNLSNMIVFVVQNNSLTGTLPEAYSSWRGLVYFAADNNKFTGTLPAAYSNWSSMTQFYIHNNILNGSLPPEWGSWAQATTFTARNNSFTGPLPSNYTSWQSLQTIDVSHNQLNGSMLENFTAWGGSVTRIILANNKLSGTIPSTWCKTMTKLALWNIANNLFEGPLSFNCNFSTFIAFAFSSNNVSGTFPFDNFPLLIVLDAQNNTHLSGILTSSVWLQIASTCGTALCAEGNTSTVTLTCLPSGFIANQPDNASPSQIVMEAKSYNISTSLCPQTSSPLPTPPLSTLAPPPLSVTPQPNTFTTAATTSVAGITTASAAVSAMLGADAAEAQMLVSILGSPCTCSGGTSATSDGSVLLLALSPFSPLGSSWAAIGNSLLCCALFGVHVLGVCVLDAAATAEHTSPKRQSVPFYRPDTSFLGRWRSSQRGRRRLLMRLRFPNLSVSLVLLLIPGVVRAVMSVINDFSSDPMDDVALSVVAIVIGVVFLAAAAAALELLVYRHIDTEVLLAKGKQQQDSLTVQVASLRSQQRGHKQFRSNDAAGAFLLQFTNHVHLETVFSPLPRNISRVVLPSGFWTPPSARKAYGTMVSSFTDAGRRWWCALPVVNAILQVLNSVSGGGSRACDALQSLTMIVLACACVLFAVVRPHRALLASYLTSLSLLLSCGVTLLAMLCRLGSVDRSAVDGFGVFVSVAMMVIKAYQAGLPYVEVWLRRRNGFTGANAAMKYFFGSLSGDVDEVPQIGKVVRMQPGRKSANDRPSRLSSETIRELLSLKYNQDEALNAVVYLVCNRNAQTQRAGFRPSSKQETKK